MGPDSAKEKASVSLTVNGIVHDLEIGGKSHQVSPSHTLAHTLRETLGLTGTKIGCDQGGCGSCTVILDGRAVLSCTILTVECQGCAVTTIEGLQDPRTGALHPLQQAFIDHSAFQCGFCTPGIIMAAKALLDHHPAPAREQVQEALAGHYCRCISHYQVLEAILDAASRKDPDS